MALPDVAFPVERFAGLNLRGDPQEVGPSQALNLLNVTFAKDGRLVTRDGYSKPFTGGPSNITNLWPLAGESALAAFNADSVKVLNLGTGAVTATTSLAAATSSFASAGAAGSTYFTDTTTAQLRKWNGSAFSSPASLSGVKGRYLAVQPLEDRLVVADATNTSKILFSNAGDPETFSANDFVTLTPGDGEEIAGMAVFGTLLFVFKRTKFFVFTGNSVAATGTSVFNYRMVDSGIGCQQTTGDTRPLIVSHTTGVYFVADDGIYRTAGDTPARVSDSISPVFKGANLTVPASFTLDTSPVTSWGFLGVAADRLYLCPFSSNGTYVLDLHTGDWSAFDWQPGAVMDGSAVATASDTNGYRGAVVLGFVTDVGLSNRAKTTDNGSAIAWSYESGMYPLAEGGARVAITRESRLWGSGSAALKIANDFGAYDTGSTLTLGTSPATADAWQQIDREGTYWQHKLSGSGQAAVSRLVHYVSFVKPAGIG